METEPKENVIINLTFEFALKVIEFCDGLDELRKFALSNQLFKSGTSIGANVNEAQSAESKNDFIHKMKIADKEAQETWYWLMLCNAIESYPNDDELLKEIESIIKVLGKIISTSKS